MTRYHLWFVPSSRNGTLRRAFTRPRDNGRTRNTPTGTSIRWGAGSAVYFGGGPLPFPATRGSLGRVKPRTSPHQCHIREVFYLICAGLSMENGKNVSSWEAFSNIPLCLGQRPFAAVFLHSDRCQDQPHGHQHATRRDHPARRKRRRKMRDFQREGPVGPVRLRHPEPPQEVHPQTGAVRSRAAASSAVG